MKRLIASAALAALVSCGASHAPGGGSTARSTAAAQARGAIVAATVVRVVDGDTIIVTVPGGSKERVRLIGVNSPESTVRVEPFGKDASRFTSSLLAPGTTVYLERDVSARDRYGRLLDYVWLRPPRRRDAAEIQNDMLDGILLRDGYAQVATYPPDVRYVADFRAIEKRARDAGRGLWSAR